MFATDLVEAIDGSITLVHAVNPDVSNLDGEGAISSLSDADERLLVESVEDAEERGLSMLDDAEGLAAQPGCDVDSELLYGAPAEAIRPTPSRRGSTPSTLVIGIAPNAPSSRSTASRSGSSNG